MKTFQILFLSVSFYLQFIECSIVFYFICFFNKRAVEKQIITHLTLTLNLSIRDFCLMFLYFKIYIEEDSQKHKQNQKCAQNWKYDQSLKTKLQSSVYNKIPSKDILKLQTQSFQQCQYISLS